MPPDGSLEDVERDNVKRQQTMAELQALQAEIVQQNQALIAARAALEAERDALREAKRVAEQASRARDYFLAVLSHELRTPLTPVLATASMLVEDPRLDNDLRESMEVIRRNTELEARLIDDLLDLTRLARGAIELERRPIEIGMILRRTLEVCMPDIEARDLRFGTDIRCARQLVEADAGRLQQVFWNLLRNAVKFTPPGGCVGLRCWEADGQVITEVNDSGVGIEPQALARIFDAFEQAEHTVTRKFGGLGLGLAISKALVELHGGRITAESPGKGGGAKFTVRLPVPAPQAAPQPAAEGAPPESGDQGAGRGLRILLVEDHGDTARIIRRLLSIAGHHVETAADAGTALERMARQDFDLLISDLGLPDRSGLELMRELRAGGRTVPGIAVTGFGQEDDIERTRAVGFATHLTKPIDFEQLETAIANVTGFKAATRIAR